MGSARPVQPGAARTGAGRGGSLLCPSRYVNKGKEMSAREPRVPGLARVVAATLPMAGGVGEGWAFTPGPACLHGVIQGP